MADRYSSMERRRPNSIPWCSARASVMCRRMAVCSRTGACAGTPRSCRGYSEARTRWRRPTPRFNWSASIQRCSARGGPLTLGRATAARRDCAGARGAPGRAATRRAIRGSGRDHARGPAGVVPGIAPPPPGDRDPRDARPARGEPPRGSRRRAAPWPSRASCAAWHTPHRTGDAVRGRVARASGGGVSAPVVSGAGRPRAVTDSVPPAGRGPSRRGRVEAVWRVVHPGGDVRAAAGGARHPGRPAAGTGRHADRVRRAAERGDRRVSGVYRHRVDRDSRLATEPDARVVFARVAAALAVRDSVRWLPPLGFENTYAIAVRRGTADSLHLETLSDLARSGSGLRGGFTADFIGRPDGLPGLVRVTACTCETCAPCFRP